MLSVTVAVSLEEYVRMHSQSLCRTAHLLTGDPQLGEDLVQASLAKVVKSWDRITAAGDPTAYLRTALVRTMISWRRRRWTGEVPTWPMPHVPAHDETASVGTRDALRRGLLQLAPRQRAALVLRFYEDLSEAETADVLGCSIGTVKSQTAKGLARLRAVMNGDDSKENPQP
jgi:RNA polymerase sigma-70 factor (sigma-E family)